jgi:hypothetical protein
MSGWWSALAERRAALRPYVTSGELLLCLRIFLYGFAVPTIWRLRPLGLGAFPARPAPRGSLREADVERLAACVETVLWAGRPALQGGCLVRGVTLHHFLMQGGCDVSLVFGVGRINGELRGHCWLTRRGEPYLEAQDPRRDFVPMHSVP